FLNGAISRHRPAEHRTIAVGAGNFIGTDGSEKYPAALMHFGTDGQRHRRKYGAGEELGAALLDLRQHFSDATARIALTVDRDVVDVEAIILGQRLHGQMCADVTRLADASKRARQWIKTAKLDLL